MVSKEFWSTPAGKGTIAGIVIGIAVIGVGKFFPYFFLFESNFFDCMVCCCNSKSK